MADNPLIDIENRICPGCKKSAVNESGGLVVAFGQSFFHVDCFKCAKCNNQVTADTNLLLFPDGSPVCAECSYNCNICQLPILDEAIMTGDDSYHAHCFQCKVCHNRIDESVFAKTSHGIYCMNCHNERMAKIRRHAQRKREKEKAARDREARDPPPENALSDRSQNFSPPASVRSKTSAHTLRDAPSTQSLQVSVREVSSSPTRKSRSVSPVDPASTSANSTVTTPTERQPESQPQSTLPHPSEQSQSFVTTIAPPDTNLALPELPSLNGNPRPPNGHDLHHPLSPTQSQSAPVHLTGSNAHLSPISAMDGPPSMQRRKSYDDGVRPLNVLLAKNGVIQDKKNLPIPGLGIPGQTSRADRRRPINPGLALQFKETLPPEMVRLQTLPVPPDSLVGLSPSKTHFDDSIVRSSNTSLLRDNASGSTVHHSLSSPAIPEQERAPPEPARSCSASHDPQSTSSIPRPTTPLRSAPRPIVTLERPPQRSHNGVDCANDHTNGHLGSATPPRLDGSERSFPLGWKGGVMRPTSPSHRVDVPHGVESSNGRASDDVVDTPSTPSPGARPSSYVPPRASGELTQTLPPNNSVHLDRKLSATARLPRRSTIVESPAGRTVHPSEPVNAQRSQQEIKLPQPQRGRTPELGEVPNLRGEHRGRALDFEQHSSKQRERLGDIAVDAQRYDQAISHYATALSFNPPSSQDILIKRSKAFLATRSWKQALDDANQAIMLDPSSPCGYEVKHAALHKAGDYDNAVDAFEVMLSRIMESPDPKVQRLGDQYISPSSTRATIRKIVQRTIRHLPRVLVNTTTGRLHDRAEQASTFEALPIFNELVSSMKTRVDYVRIKCEIRQYFRYVMLSHKWEDNEPLFQQVALIAAYDLDKSPTHDKLQMFCKIVRDAGFNWAWSDTCCINKSDHFVLQEALVAMFKWYQDSAMMFVFLRGVRSPSQRGALVKSIWNTRAWTLQEYVASKVIRFYTEDWTLYLDLELSNHKESPEVISEMEDATGVSAQLLMTLRPGLTCIREKLRLASTRQTTLVEDAAYSLLGIFSVTGIPAIYGEGEGSLGRLLAHILAGSGDVSILAWTGESGCFNSCLPAHITVFNGPATSHLPSPIPDAEMEIILAVSHLSSFDLDVALKLYDRLDELPAPWFAASRMKLPCIAFQLPPLSPYRTRSGRVYRVDTVVFGMVEIKTRQDLSRMKSLYLVHPWLETILDRDEEQSGAFIEDDEAPPPSPSTDDEEGCDEKIDDDFSSLLERESLLLPALERMAPMDREMRARRLVARLRQPFGALLVTLAAAGRRAVDYRRVAADCLITVQIQDNFPLSDLLDNVRTFDVL